MRSCRASRGTRSSFCSSSPTGAHQLLRPRRNTWNGRRKACSDHAAALPPTVPSCGSTPGTEDPARSPASCRAVFRGASCRSAQLAHHELPFPRSFESEDIVFEAPDMQHRSAGSPLPQTTQPPARTRLARYPSLLPRRRRSPWLHARSAVGPLGRAAPALRPLFRGASYSARRCAEPGALFSRRARFSTCRVITEAAESRQGNVERHFRSLRTPGRTPPECSFRGPRWGQSPFAEE